MEAQRTLQRPRDPFLAFRVQWAPWGHSPEPKQIRELFRCSNSSCHLMSITSSTSVFFSFWAWKRRCHVQNTQTIRWIFKLLNSFPGFQWVALPSQSKEPKKCMHDSAFQNACLSHGSPLHSQPHFLPSLGSSQEPLCTLAANQEHVHKKMFFGAT